ncbi:MAG: lipopolysaccharide kinase InaA family protein [Candidatus Scalinduaceae bacterium]
MPYNTASIKTVQNGTNWTIREGYESLLDKIDFDNFDSVLREKPHKIIKETKVRSVISIPGGGVNDTGIYVKLFKGKNYSDYVKYLLLPTKTKTEWKVANKLLSEDINTTLPLAIAENKSWSLLKSDLLVTEAISNGKPLIEFCEANFKDMLSGKKIIEKKKLLNNLAKFIRNIHVKGFFHNDLHAGNLLIKFHNNHPIQEQSYTFYLMDLHHVRIFNKLSKRKKLYNLAQIFNSLSSTLTKSDRLEFVKSYGIDALSNNNNEQDLTNQIESISSRIRNIHYRSRLKRCLKESSNFSNKKLGRLRIFFRKGYDTDSFLKLIEKHHIAIVNNDKNAILKRDSKTTLTRFPFKDKEIRSVVVKQYKTTCGLCLIKNIFRSSTGRKAWIAGNGLLVYGYNTAKPLALIEKKILGITTDSYLIMEDVTNSLEMDRYILKNFHNQSSPGELKKTRTFIADFAKTIANMHNENVFHSDLKTCNIMVKEIEDKSYDFIFLDFDKVIFNDKISIHKRINNLIQLNLSTPGCITYTDRFRFLTEYLSACLPERSSQSDNAQAGLKQCNIIDEKKTILREIINISKTEKLLYVSSKGDVTEDW